MTYTIDDLPERYQAQAREKLAAAPQMPLRIVGETAETAQPEPLELKQPDAESEEKIQAAAIAELKRHDFIVLQTTHRYNSQACPACGHWARPTGGYGATPGVPDLLCSREEWPRGVWFGIEKKSATGTLSPAQVLLEAQARIVVTRTAAAALAEADTLSRAFAKYGMPPPYVSAAAVAKARDRVRKALEAKQIAAAKRKRGRR